MSTSVHVTRNKLSFSLFLGKSHTHASFLHIFLVFPLSFFPFSPLFLFPLSIYIYNFLPKFSKKNTTYRHHLQFPLCSFLPTLPKKKSPLKKSRRKLIIVSSFFKPKLFNKFSPFLFSRCFLPHFYMLLCSHIALH